MALLRKFGLVMWKNWILRVRHYILSVFDIVLPLLFTAMLLVIRSQNTQDDKSQYINTTQSYDAKTLPYDCNGRVTIMYSPPNDQTVQFMTAIKDELDTNSCNVTLWPVADEVDMVQQYELSNLYHVSSFLGGIVFLDGFSMDEKTETKLHYRIRPRSYYWDMNIDPSTNEGPYSGSGDYNYDNSGFLLLQHTIAMKFIEMSSRTSKIIKEMKVFSQKFPYPPYEKESGYTNTMKIIMPLFVVLSFIFVAPSIIRGIVVEKDCGTMELLKLMGLPGWIQWLGCFTTYFVIMTISSLIIVILLCCILSPAVFAESRFELVLIIFLLYIASAIFFCFFISSIFSKPTLATAVGILAWLVTFVAPYYPTILSSSYTRLPLSAKMSLALLPNMAMSWALRIILSLESRGHGLQWNNLSQALEVEGNLCMLHVLLMLVVDIVLYGFLTWYIDSVFPGKYGVRKPWYFLFTKSYWIKEKVTEADVELLSHDNSSINFEKDPVNLEPTIIIKNLSKRYGFLPQSKLAVDGLTLNFYEGQITALLGHNGAGKTTTMSMLTGMFSPTSGTAVINGYDIRTHMDSARESIGLCPQHNMLFNDLTVSEHLELYGKLKNKTGMALTNEVNELLTKLQLLDKRRTFAKNLSGGMKRKLSLGISLIGGSKVVMLDEPTSGLDPEARRAIWDLLQQYRPGRCIILSTHFMEEADVLGDRIAIMAQGRAHCYGTPYFLKKRYGAGYHLTVTKTSNCDTTHLGDVIQRHLSEAYLNSQVNNELSYILPSDKMTLFPALFEELESNLENLGVNGFGVSVTTMEEVFLKVGELSEQTADGYEENQELTKVAAVNGKSETTTFNSGFNLIMQRLFGLILKRWHYTRRRWILLIAQVIIPVLITVVLMIVININASTKNNSTESLKMDISQYGPTVVLYNSTGAVGKELADKYSTVVISFASKDTVTSVDNVADELISVGKNSIYDYQQKYIVAASFEASEKADNGTCNITALYNGVYLHSLPLAVNLIHNTILQHSKSNGEIIVENSPLPEKSYSSSGNPNTTVISIVIGIFMVTGLSFLSSSFVVFPIQERTSKSKHLQLMTGVGGTLFWGVSILWDFLIHLISCILIIIVLVIMDNQRLFTEKDETGVVVLTLLLYGWAIIPFTYMMSFICETPSGGFSLLSVVNMIAGMFLSIMTNVFSGKDAIRMLRWFFRFLPSYGITVCFMNIPMIAQMNSMCDNFVDNDGSCNTKTSLGSCCPGCVGDYCFKKTPYLDWSNGLGQEVFMLFLDGALYLLLLALIERGIMYRAAYKLRSLRMSRKQQHVAVMPNMELYTHYVDNDVAAEKQRIENLFATTGEPSDDALLVNSLTKNYWGLQAVDKLSFGVKNAECFGLLGINGAGKTTTFQMLTGDEFITSGNAFLHGISLKTDRGQFLQQISYCPQFDALLDHLTGRETLLLFARLRGIPESEIQQTIQQYLFMFDLTQHADKVTMAYSGGNKRKLSAAMAFLGNPRMIFLDEPTTGVDPVARRKLWDILLAAKNRGTSLILTSHSMEECEVLCSRIAIMVNGQFKCLGAIQHLKSKFGQGFTIIAKMGACADSTVQTNTQEALQNFMNSKFPRCVLKDVHQGLIHYHITDARTPWRYLFSTMEQAKQTFNLEDYSVSQTTLEQVFLSFARQQRNDTDPNLQAIT